MSWQKGSDVCVCERARSFSTACCFPPNRILSAYRSGRRICCARHETKLLRHTHTHAVCWGLRGKRCHIHVLKNKHEIRLRNTLQMTILEKSINVKKKCILFKELKNFLNFPLTCRQQCSFSPLRSHLVTQLHAIYSYHSERQHYMRSVFAISFNHRSEQNNDGVQRGRSILLRLMLSCSLSLTNLKRASKREMS